MKKILARAICRAAPSCTLWVFDIQQQVYRFRFWPNIYITIAQILRAYEDEPAGFVINRIRRCK